MPLTIEKLRRYLLLAASLIVAGIAILLLIAQHERRKLLHDLPARLGVDIQQQTNEFTYSQSIQGKTLFTLHAAKAVQMKAGGNIKLHDVTIILYGRRQDRADRIAGEEFDYDPNSGIARAAGDVFLDLQAPAKAVAASVKSSAAADATKNLADAKAAGVVHVTTRGLVFQQKEGLASTDQEITFQFGGGVTGHAMGAQYDSGKGVITLDSAVAADTTLHGRPVHVTAAHGELNRDTNLCIFNHAAYVANGETATADLATVQMRSDGSAEHVETSGNVTLTLANGGAIRTPHAFVVMNAVSEPKDLQANGGVNYSGTGTTPTGVRETQGDAATAHIVFNNDGVAQRAELNGGVHTLEREKPKGSSAWTERELHAATVDMVFRNDAGVTTLHEVKAIGDAQLRATAPAAKSPQTATTLFTGDTLDAIFPTRAAAMPETVSGIGHTVLTQTAADGTVSESHGDTLDVQMLPQAKQKSRTPIASPIASQIARAVQQGHVTLTQTPAAKLSHAQPLTATAERAEYTGSDDALVLTGTPQSDPQVSDSSAQGAMQITARRVRVLRMSGDALFSGNVRGSYAGSGSQPPAHVVADRAEMHRADQHAIFYGAGYYGNGSGRTQQRARLWQDQSQVEAPVLDFDRAAQRLTASGNPADAAAVHAVFAAASAANPEQNTAQKKSNGVVRIASRRMVYMTQAAGASSSSTANAPRQAEFSGGVAVESSEAKIEAQRAVVTLAPAPSGKGQPQPGTTLPALGGTVQKIVASAQVVLAEAGRQGFGEQLVYTPNPTAPDANPTKSSGRFVLTGLPAAPPRLIDPVKGTITGASLIFNSGDDSVVVSSGNGTAGRVSTELKVDP